MSTWRRMRFAWFIGFDAHVSKKPGANALRLIEHGAVLLRKRLGPVQICLLQDMSAATAIRLSPRQKKSVTATSSRSDTTSVIAGRSTNGRRSTTT